MSNSGPSTDKVEFDAVQTHGTPVDLAGEPMANPGVAPGEAVATKGETFTKKTTKRPVGEPKEPKSDQDLKQKVGGFPLAPKTASAAASCASFARALVFQCAMLTPLSDCQA